MEIHCIYCVASPCLIWIIIIPFFHHLIYPQTSAPSMRAVGGDGDLLVWWQIRLGILLLQSIFWEFCEIHKKTWTFVTRCYFCSLNSPPPLKEFLVILVITSSLLWPHTQAENPQSSQFQDPAATKVSKKSSTWPIHSVNNKNDPWPHDLLRFKTHYEYLNNINSNILHLEALNTHFLHFLGTILAIKHQQSSWWHHLNL